MQRHRQIQDFENIPDLPESGKSLSPHPLLALPPFPSVAVPLPFPPSPPVLTLLGCTASTCHFCCPDHSCPAQARAVGRNQAQLGTMAAASGLPRLVPAPRQRAEIRAIDWMGEKDQSGTWGMVQGLVCGMPAKQSAPTLLENIS